MKRNETEKSRPNSPEDIDMNASIETTKPAETSLARDWINLGRYYVGRYLGGHRGLIILTLAALGIGLALNWSWLVAIGVAPLLISLAPCAAMCALGLCMSRMGGQSCSSEPSATDKQSGARSPAPRPDVEGPSEPVVSLSDRRDGDLADDSSGDSEARADTGGQSEATRERG
jgi:hypothetical protein